MSNKVKNITIQKTEDITFSIGPDNIKIDEKSYKNIFIYNIGYLAMKEYIKIYKNK